MRCKWNNSLWNCHIPMLWSGKAQTCMNRYGLISEIDATVVRPRGTRGGSSGAARGARPGIAGERKDKLKPRFVILVRVGVQ